MCFNIDKENEVCALMYVPQYRQRKWSMCTEVCALKYVHWCMCTDVCAGIENEVCALMYVRV